MDHLNVCIQSFTVGTVHFLHLLQLVSSGHLSHSTLPSIAQNLQKHMWSPNLVISPCTLQLAHKKTLCTLDPCQMDNPFNLMWSHFLLFFTTVHMLQNIITIIRVHYHTSLKNSLPVFYYFCWFYVTVISHTKPKIFIKLKYFANLHIIFHTQFVDIFTIYLYTKFNIYRHNQ